MSTIDLAYDCGQGNGKLVGPHGRALLESFTARRTRAAVTDGLDGLKSRRARLSVSLENGQTFYVGRNAHAVGEPVEALDYDRYVGAPEQRALFYGILTTYMREHDVSLAEHRLRLTIGVPLGLLTGPEAAAKVAAIQGWLAGEHHWKIRDAVYRATVSEVRVKSQAAGALFHYMYDANGHIVRARKSSLVTTRPEGGVQFVPVGILSFGFLTMEAMAVEYQRGDTGELELVKQDRFTASRPVGIHRLLEIARPGPEWTLAELDQQYRDEMLDVRYALPIYQRDVSNALIDAWGRSGWRRFGVILVVGGGARTLGQWLLDRFEGRAFLPSAAENGHVPHPDDDLFAIAEGLYRHALRG